MLGWGVFILLLGYAVDAPLRYGLSFAHLESLVYLRDLFFVAYVGLTVIRWAFGEKQNFPVVALLYLLGVHLFFGVANLQSLIQPLMGFKVVLAFVFGFAAYRVLQSPEKSIIKAAWVIFLPVVIGVIVNYFVVYPWAGALLDVGSGQAALTREWTAGGIRRLAGFSRASFDAASIVLVLMPVVLFSLRRHLLVAFVVFMVSVVATGLTTSKGALMAQAAFLGWLVLRKITTRQRANKIFVWGSAALVTFFPLAAVLAGVRAWTGRNDMWAWWFSSFHERMYRMWPDALKNVTDHGNVILGRGLGGVGFPQYFGEASLYNSADNVAVYMYVVFGLLGLIYLAWLYRVCLLVEDSPASELMKFCVPAWAIFLAMYGFTTNMVEQPFFCLTMGAAAGLGVLGRVRAGAVAGPSSNFIDRSGKRKLPEGVRQGWSRG